MKDTSGNDRAEPARHERKGMQADVLLPLAATPAFAIMALLSATVGGFMPDMPCSAVRGGSLLTGMAPMYLLMSVVHLAPWLRLLSARTPATHATVPAGSRGR